MAKLDVTDYDVYAECNLYMAGYTEDFEEYHAECYRVIAERSDGRRFAHFATFFGCVRHEDTDCGFVGFEDIRKITKEKVQRLISCIKSAGKINKDYWTEVEAGY